MSKEFTPCANCPMKEPQANEHSEAISREVLKNSVLLTGQNRNNVFQAVSLSYMFLRHEAPSAPLDDVYGALKCARHIIYRGCAEWKYDDEHDQIVPIKSEDSSEHSSSE